MIYVYSVDYNLVFKNKRRKILKKLLKKVSQSIVKNFCRLQKLPKVKIKDTRRYIRTKYQLIYYDRYSFGFKYENSLRTTKENNLGNHSLLLFPCYINVANENRMWEESIEA